MTAAQRKQRARLANAIRWSQVTDRSAETAPARRAWEARFEQQVDPTGVLPSDVRRQMAEKAREAFFIRMQMASAKARARKKAARRTEADSRLEAGDHESN